MFVMQPSQVNLLVRFPFFGTLTANYFKGTFTFVNNDVTVVDAHTKKGVTEAF